ncbi:MAG TPA: alpha-glucosidase [Acholeplasmataceae bacterium]|nr:alpha-glucosidase [Acholeplasmataceae bacterium]HBO68431.1 alpha-glucosidase [Acholeplasmataceae bacterium]HBS00787.1 alpha-glucosidase [Acholeplasmataceae bacterium]HCZ23594.1 alpha-glucosidase [Acholeplasmataceae bacterium]
MGTKTMNMDKLIGDYTSLKMRASYGHASYAMSRGTFKTKDHIKAWENLSFHHEDEGIYWYSYDHQMIGVKPEEKDHHTILHLMNQSDFTRFEFITTTTSDEHIYGCGEQFASFDLKKKKVTIWVSEHHSVKKLVKKFLREKFFGIHPNHQSPWKDQQTYYAQPTYMSSQGYLFHAVCDSYQTYHFKENQTVHRFRSIPKDIHFFHHESFLELSGLFSKWIGIQPKLPDWITNGAIIASQGGKDALLNNVKIAKENQIPLAGVWSQDWSGNIITSFGYQVYWNWQTDEELYPNLKETIKDLNDQNIAFLGYINTFLKEDTRLYREAKALDYLVKTKQGGIYHIQSTTFQAGIVDLTYPKAYQWYKEVIKREMIDLGMNGWMADFGEYLPTDSVIHEGHPEQVHNLWPVLWAKLNHEAIVESDKENELFFFVRAGFKDTAKYAPSLWAGDQHVDFSKEDGLPSAIVSALSLATSGIGVTHSDIGGYTTILHMKRSKELLIRWAEMNVFSPIFRFHEGNQPTKNVQFSHDEDTLMHMKRLSQMFMMLTPYHQSILKEYHDFGYPLIRPLFYHIDEAWAFEESYAYMYGKDLICYPVLNKDTTKMIVRLPEGSWRQCVTNTHFDGGTHEVNTPLGMPIAFYKEKSEFRELFQQLK